MFRICNLRKIFSGIVIRFVDMALVVSCRQNGNFPIQAGVENGII
jgi:hypothetical protein